MSEELLDDNIRHLVTPAQLSVPIEAWHIECSKLTSKFNIGVIIFISLCTVVGILFSMTLVSIIGLIYGLFMIFANKKKMQYLKEYGGSSFTIDEDSFHCSKEEFASSPIEYSEVKFMTKTKAGIELSIKKGGQGRPSKIYIPNAIDAYNSVVNFLEAKNLPS